MILGRRREVRSDADSLNGCSAVGAGAGPVYVRMDAVHFP
jgi:hypothetical protein